MGPVVFRRACGNAERVGHFVVGQPNEVAQFHYLGFLWVRGGKLFERFVHGQELVVVARKRQLHVVEVDALLATAMAHGFSTPGAFDQNPPHRLGGRSKKVGAILECRRLIPDKPQPGFVDESSGLERLSGGFVSHLARGEPAQFLIDQRQKLIGGFGIAGFNGAKKLGRFTHAVRIVAATLAKTSINVTTILVCDSETVA